MNGRGLHPSEADHGICVRCLTYNKPCFTYIKTQDLRISAIRGCFNPTASIGQQQRKVRWGFLWKKRLRAKIASCKALSPATGGALMDMPIIGAYASGFVIIFFYAMSQFNKVPPAGHNASEPGASLPATVRQWFQLKEHTDPLILPPPRANTTAFKYWLYRLAYALIWVATFTVIMRVPGVKDSIPSIVGLVTTGALNITGLDLANGIAVAFLMILLTRIPPLRGADATIRHAMYEHASIPAQQLGFQFQLRGAAYIPDADITEATRKSLRADGFGPESLELDPEPTTRSLWLKTCILMRYVETWGKSDRYKTALALLREPRSDTLSVDRVRETYEALKSDARICLHELKHKPDCEETRLREEQFRRDTKSMLESIYSLLTHVALRSHYSYYDAIEAVRKIGFEVEGSVAPLPDKNDVVAMAVMLFWVTTVPLAYRLGFGRALTITGIYLLAVLTPIYLASECPRLLRRKREGMPPLAFPPVAGAIAGFVAATVSIAIGAICPGGQCAQLWSIDAGIGRLLHHTYPWPFMVCFLTIVLATLMLIGEYPEEKKLTGLARYQRWGNLRDALILSLGAFGFMAFYVIPELNQLTPEQFPEKYFWLAPGLILRPVATSFLIGLVMPTWYRGNTLRIREDGRRHLDEPPRPHQEEVPVAP
jgi:hypothetical protein